MNHFIGQLQHFARFLRKTDESVSMEEFHDLSLRCGPGAADFLGDALPKDLLVRLIRR